MGAQQGAVRIGISGWTFAPWRGHFYPAEVKQKAELHYASRQFRTIEINGTFYSLQKPDSFAKWAAETPDKFVFSVKGPRFITHSLRLKDVERPLANFFASGVLRLGQKLGPFLWQLPHNMRFDAALLEAFLKQLPHDTHALAALAEKHDDHLKKGAWTRADTLRKVRHTFEVRHESFADPAFIAMMRAHGVAVVCIDSGTDMGLFDLTADFVYCRLRDARDAFPTGYGDEQIDTWADRMTAWASGKPVTGGRTAGAPAAEPAPSTKRDVFAYFEHEAKLHAPENARRLSKRVEQRRD